MSVRHEYRLANRREYTRNADCAHDQRRGFMRHEWEAVLDRFQRILISNGQRVYILELCGDNHFHRHDLRRRVRDSACM